MHHLAPIVRVGGDGGPTCRLGRRRGGTPFWCKVLEIPGDI